MRFWSSWPISGIISLKEIGDKTESSIEGKIPFTTTLFMLLWLGGIGFGAIIGLIAASFIFILSALLFASFGVAIFGIAVFFEMKRFKKCLKEIELANEKIGIKNISTTFSQ